MNKKRWMKVSDLNDIWKAKVKKFISTPIGNPDYTIAEAVELLKEDLESWEFRSDVKKELKSIIYVLERWGTIKIDPDRKRIG